MNATKHLRNIGEFSNPYLNHFTGKVKAGQRRSFRTNFNGYNDKRTHWANHTGTYRDEELIKGPKYWYGQKPTRINGREISYKYLTTAIKLIALGNKNYSEYKRVSEPNRARLRLAQLLNNKGVIYNALDIMRLNIFEVRKGLLSTQKH